MRELKLLLVLLAFILLLASPVQTCAQGGVGSTRGLPETSGGTNMLEGRVRVANGISGGPGITVKLEGTMVVTRTAVTDQDGKFVFRSLPSGEYTLSIDGGTDYAPVRQAVTIHGTAGGAIVGQMARVLSVDVHLFPKSANVEETFLGVPDAAVESYRKGREAARAGNAKKAIEHFKKATDTDPKFRRAFAELGTQYLKIGDMDGLFVSMTTLLKLNPADGRAHLNLGIALYNRKQLADAEAHLRKSLEINQTDPVAHYYLGMTLLVSKNYPEAEKELELAIRNGGENIALAHKYLGGLYMSSKKNQQAADELEKYLQLEPKAADGERIKSTIKELRSKQ